MRIWSPEYLLRISDMLQVAQLRMSHFKMAYVVVTRPPPLGETSYNRMSNYTVDAARHRAELYGMNNTGLKGHNRRRVVRVNSEQDAR